MVSGCFEEDTAHGTDLFTDTKSMFQETEAAIDYSASILCAFGGYADLPAGSFSHCTGRSPFDGRL